jgi:hypothetical protein
MVSDSDREKYRVQNPDNQTQYKKMLALMFFEPAKKLLLFE